jgi:hypothetical protein
MSLLRAWRILTWKHWAWATAVPVLISITMPLQQFDTNWYWAHWRVFFDTPLYLFFSYLFLFAIALAESSALPGSEPSTWRYIATLAVASFIGVATLGIFPELVTPPPKQIIAGKTFANKTKVNRDTQAKARRLDAMLGLGTKALIHGWLATFIYVRLRKSRHAARVLAQAEIERTEAQRNLLAAQLVAAHAQVDPAFVLRALEKVELTYETDPAGADALLDDLIAFLRDAIPRLRAEERLESA